MRSDFRADRLQTATGNAENHAIAHWTSAEDEWGALDDRERGHFVHDLSGCFLQWRTDKEKSGETVEPSYPVGRSKAAIGRIEKNGIEEHALLTNKNLVAGLKMIEEPSFPPRRPARRKPVHERETCTAGE